MKKQLEKKKNDFIKDQSNKAIPHLHATVRSVSKVANELPNAKTVSIKEIYAGVYQTTEFYKPITTILIDL